MEDEEARPAQPIVIQSPPPTIANPGWSFDTLRQYVDTKIDSLALIVNHHDIATRDRVAATKESVASALVASKESIKNALESTEKAIIKAEAALEKRLTGLNEIRDAMMDQQRLFADKGETTYKFAAFEKRLDEAHAVNTKRLDLIEQTLASTTGKSVGTSQVASIIVQIISSAGTLVAMGLALYAINSKPPPSSQSSTRSTEYGLERSFIRDTQQGTCGRCWDAKGCEPYWIGKS